MQHKHAARGKYFPKRKAKNIKQTQRGGGNAFPHEPHHAHPQIWVVSEDAFRAPKTRLAFTKPVWKVPPFVSVSRPLCSWVRLVPLLLFQNESAGKCGRPEGKMGSRGIGPRVVVTPVSPPGGSTGVGSSIFSSAAVFL